MPKYDYKTARAADAREKAKAISAELPGFVSDYLIAKAASLSASSLLSYIYNISEFIRWWHGQVPELSQKDIKDITVEDMGNVTARDINEYLWSGLTATQGAKALAHKCSAISSLYDHLTALCGLEGNPMDKVERPKIERDKRIIRLEQNEVAKLLRAIDENDFPKMSQRQRKYLLNTKERDYAIVSLLLGTGIRVSECVGLNIEDIFFETHEMQITRKGNKKQTLYISDEVLEAIQNYMTIRDKTEPTEIKDRQALFLSTRGTRLCPAAIENMLRVYTTALSFGKNITPHKLRKTYGTNLYQCTGDIYLVATALGHESVATTTHFYVDDNTRNLEQVRNAMVLNPDAKKKPD